MLCLIPIIPSQMVTFLLTGSLQCGYALLFKFCLVQKQCKDGKNLPFRQRVIKHIESFCKMFGIKMSSSNVSLVFAVCVEPLKPGWHTTWPREKVNFLHVSHLRPLYSITSELRLLSVWIDSTFGAVHVITC